MSATGLLPIAERRVLLDEVTRLVEGNKMRSVIDRCFPLERLADAYRRVESGVLRGTVVVTMDHAPVDHTATEHTA